MWVYKGDDLDFRASLEQTVGSWLDYWLLLHFDQVHSPLSSRPIGVLSLCEAALQAKNLGHYSATASIANELRPLIRWLSTEEWFPDLPAGFPAKTKAGWQPEWEAWFERMAEPGNSEHLLTCMSDALANSIASSNPGSVGFYSRRLSAELPHLGITKDYVTTCALNGLQSRALMDARSALDAIPRAHLHSGNQNWLVEVSVSPTRLSNSQYSYLKNLAPVVPILSPDNEKRVLIGFSILLKSVSTVQALALALPSFSEHLSRIRLGKYIRTHLHGAARIINEATQAEQWLALPQPFWRPGEDRRSVPSLPAIFPPKNHTLPGPTVAKIIGAKWHLNLAFGSWNEDSHATASSVWQALEAYCEPNDQQDGRKNTSKLTNTQAICDRSALLYTNDISYYFNKRVNSQAYSFKSKNMRHSWRIRAFSKGTLHDWLSESLTPHSSHSFENWLLPFPPQMALSSTVGYRSILDSFLTGSYPQWLRQRLHSDLALLYGVRNLIVHSGVKLFRSTVTDYLSRTGAELLFLIMNNDISSSTDRQTADAPASQGAGTRHPHFG